ncbi:hypothetical protein BJY01DRAFT_245639 [Aspergillus pseudoustus]|uniref:Starter acyltransferase (SAT) domain-containing protein n=1 Tax=Aspergillus pseudoustus TaxID=1810923 RepID=A0ABR4KD11_9EURO
MSLFGQIGDQARVMKSADGKGPTTLYSGNRFPSDDLTDLLRRLQQESKDRGFWILNAHLRVSTLVLQEEISKLPHHIRGQVPQFDDIAILSENGHMRHLGLGPAIESALLIVLQLGLFIRRHEALENKLDLRDNVTIVAGLRVGLFPRVAISQSTTLTEVVKKGAVSLRVSFRLGLFVGDFSQRLEAPQSDGFQRILAHAVTSMTEEKLNVPRRGRQEQYRRYTGGGRYLVPHGYAFHVPALLLFFHLVSAAPLGAQRAASDLRFRSRVALGIGNDSSIGYEERLYTGAGNKSLIRHYMETISTLAGPTADTLNVLCALGEIMPGAELLRVSWFTAHIKPSLVDEPTRYPAGSLLLIGLPCAPDASGDGLVIKALHHPNPEEWEFTCKARRELC